MLCSSDSPLISLQFRVVGERINETRKMETKRRRVEKTRKNIHTPSFLADLPSFVSLLGEF